MKQFPRSAPCRWPSAAAFFALVLGPALAADPILASIDARPHAVIDRAHPGASDAPAPAAKGGGDEVFKDGFEPFFVEPPLLGSLRFTTDAFDSPVPRGTQLETQSEPVFTSTGFRFLQADTGLLGRVSPDPLAYQKRVDFDRMTHSPSGVVEARLTAVDLSLANPAASTSGCEATDFAAFPAGHIALIQRGTCSFRVKAQNAEAAGASGVIVFNQGTPDRLGFFTGTLDPGYRGQAPVVSVSFALGSQWAAAPGATFRVRVDASARNNGWELVPVVRASATANVFWLRNAVTGELLATRPTVIDGQVEDSVVLDASAPDDNRAWWIVQGSTLRNVRNSTNLTVRTTSAGILLLATTALSTQCQSGTSCSVWTLDQRFARPPAGATRLRSSFGDYYLRVDGTRVEVARARPGWPDTQWVLEVVPNSPFRRLLNLQTGDYLHVETGTLQAGAVQPGWFSAMWELETATQIAQANVPGGLTATALTTPITNATGYTRLRNRWTGQYLLAAASGLAVAGSSATDALQALWVLDDAPIPAIGDATLRSRIAALLGRAPADPILSSEAAGVYALAAADAGISSLAGLSAFTNLTDLRLAGNAITNVAPIAALPELSVLDLSRNPVASIAPLEANAGIGDGDTVLLLRTSLGQAAPTDRAAFRTRRANLVPSPGMMALHEVASGRVVDTASGTERLVDPALARDGVDWSLEYDVAQTRFRLRNPNMATSPQGGYLTWNDQDNRLEFGSRNNGLEWRFELVSTGQYRVRNTRLSGSQPFLLVCGDRLDINASGCATGVWYIDAALIAAAQQRAIDAYYDPAFAAPASGFTRIQHTRSREFLSLVGGAPVMARVVESDTAAQWLLVPVALDRSYLFAIRNRQDPTRYLSRDANGQLRTGPLPGAAPGADDWATVAANQPFLFAIDGTENYFVRPLQQRTNYLGVFNAAPRFEPSVGGGTVWRFDGGVKTPAPAQGTSFVEIRREDAPLYNVTFTLSWKQRSSSSNSLVTVNRTGPGVFVMPSDAQDIRAKAVCNGCGAFFSDRTVFDLRFDRPPNRCYETRGPFFDPHHGRCESLSGQIAAFTVNAAQQATCELQALVNFLPVAFDQLAIEDIAADLLAQDFESAQARLFAQGDVSGPDLSGCDSYESMTFGAGASAGVFNLNVGGGIGVAWGLTQATSGALSYTATGGSFDSTPRLLSVSAPISLGVWKDRPTKLQGGAVGFSMAANRNIPIDLRQLKKLKSIGLSGGITLWFGCDTGTGQILNSYGCTIRTDSRFVGFTFDFSAGVDIALPVPGAIAINYAKTCVPANFSGNDCD